MAVNLSFSDQLTLSTRRLRVRQVSCLRPCLAGEFIERDALANNTTNREIKSLTVRHLAIVVAIRLLIQVTEQVKGFHAHVRSIDTALQERPEIFQTIRVDAPSTDRKSVV